MNIAKFIEALSEEEREQLRDYFLNENKVIVDDKESLKVYELISLNPEMSTRLKNILIDYYGVDYTVKRIDKYHFLKARNAGENTWDELARILQRNNIPIKEF
jgi:hypothetical protein